jgi:lysophospholipase L1-like esterase
MVGDSITRRTNVALVQNGTKEATWDDLLGIKAYNMGVDGETSADVLKRLDTLVHPDIDCYFLMIGNNDLHAGIPIPEIVANVATIVQYLQSQTGKPVVIQAVMPLFAP